MAMNVFERIRRWRFLQRGQRDADLQHEIDTHTALEIDDAIERGMSAAEAERWARVKIGSTRRIREEVWQMNSMVWMENVLRDVRYGFRTLRRSPGFTVIAVLTLGLGIGANTAIFSVVNGVLLRPLPYRDSGRIIHIEQHAVRLAKEAFPFSVKEIEDYRQRSHTLDSVAEHHSMTFTLIGGSEPQRVITGVISANFFDVFGVKPMRGRALLPSDESVNAAPVLVLSHSYWMKQLNGDKNVIGRKFEMNDRVHTVVGVMPELPEYPSADEVYMPTTSCPFRSKMSMIEDRDSRMMDAFARMKPGVKLEMAIADLNAVSQQLQHEYPKSYPADAGYTALPVTVAVELTHAARPTFLILLAASALVLLLACANVANFTISRQMRRSRELAIRTAIGATRMRILRQLLTESLLIAFAGGALGLLLAAAGRKMLVAYASKLTTRTDDIHIDGAVLLFTLAVSLITGVAAGIVPGLSRNRNATAGLNDTGERVAGDSRNGLRNGLVVVQVAIAFLLLAGAGLMLRSFYNLIMVDPGFKPEHVVTMHLPLNWTRYKDDAARVQFYRRVLEQAQRMPGVTTASLSMTVPLESDMIDTEGVTIEGQPRQTGEPQPRIDYQIASPDYFRTLGTPVLAGRVFTDGDTKDTMKVGIVNARMAEKFWPRQDAVGHRVSGDDGKSWITIVGVVKDVRQYGLAQDPAYQLYLPLEQYPISEENLFLRTSGDPMRVASAMTRSIHAGDPEQPVTQVRTLDEVRHLVLGTPLLTTTLMGLFAGVALFITVSGIWAMLSLMVGRKTREIGIRIALGATRGDVLGGVLRQGMIPVAIGLGIGLGGALLTTRILTSMLFQIGANDPLTFLLIAVALLGAALAACTVPARRAARIDPMTAIRSE